jgi:chromosome partitioning protein
VSTSGWVHTGLGWPSQGSADDEVPSGHLGWPGSETQERGAEHGSDAQPTAPHTCDEDLPTNFVSRETVTGSVAEESSERDQLAASLPEPGAETPLAQAVAADARRRISLTGKVFPRPDHTRILTVANQKGGVGKTTTTVNVAAALAQAGLRVLVIDIDPQGNASTALGIDHHAEVPSIYDVLLDGKAVTEVVQECVDVPNLWCIPATIDLAGAEIELVSVVARETRMQRALSAYIADMADRREERLDYVLIDCPPSLGLLTVNAFVAADEVLIPIQCEYYALEGLSQLLKNVELIKSHLNPGLHVSTILLTMYDGRTRLSAQVADEVRSHFPAHVLRTTVPRSVRISEAPSHGQTVMTYDPGSSGALSYLEAASELADRGVSVNPVQVG